MPTAVQSALADEFGGEWDSVRALSRVNRDGFGGQVQYLAETMRAACSPIDRGKLVQRLTALGMTMAPNRPQAEATMWVHETARLLGDIAEDILLAAIDDYQLANKFLPTVAEIRERADGPMGRRRREAARLDAMARLIASGAHIPVMTPREPEQVKPPEPPCTPEQARAIVEEMGLSVEATESLRKHLGPPRKPTRADYLALGVNPDILDAA